MNKQEEYIKKVINTLVRDTIHYPESHELLIPHCGRPFHTDILKMWEKEGFFTSGFHGNVQRTYGLNENEVAEVCVMYGKRIKRKIRY